MDQTKRAAVTIIDRNYPPSRGINGESACDLAEYLLNRNIDVSIVHVDVMYEGGGTARKPVGRIFKVPTFYQGKNKLLRLFGSLAEGFMLVRKALRVNQGLIICMTNPPLLQFWASVFFKRKKIPWILWSMDLFPQAFVANGLVTDQHMIYKLIKKHTYAYPPSSLIALGPMQAQFISKEYKQPIDNILLPCGVFTATKGIAAEVPSWKTTEKIIFGYCGNLGEAHSVEFLKVFIEEFDPEKHVLILSVYGNNAKMIAETARAKSGIIYLDNVPRSQLKYIDVHLVSLLKKWNHICVPSKAVSAVCSGSAILFCGSEQSDNWEMMKDAGWLISQEEDIRTQVRKYLQEVNTLQITGKHQAAEKIALELSELIAASYNTIADTISNSQSQ